MRLTLPWPPSVNKYYRHINKGQLAGRNLISEEGRAFRSAVDAVVRQARARKAMAFPLEVRVAAYPPDRRKRDLDNLLKATLDALQSSGVYLNDNQIESLSIYRAEPVAGGQLEVQITALDTGWRQALGDVLT
jgi:crossover junction endodeoxyribonuclease RusA